MVNAASVMERKIINIDDILEMGSDDDNGESTLLRENGVANVEELTLPLPNVSRKALEERERRAMRIAEESFGHINQRVRCQVLCSYLPMITSLIL